MDEMLERLDQTLNQVKMIESALEKLKTEVVKNITASSKARVKNSGMLDYKQLCKLLNTNQVYVYKEIERCKRKYRLTYEARTLPVNIVSKEFGLDIEVIYQVTEKAPAPTGTQNEICVKISS